MGDRDAERLAMVRAQIEQRGVRDERVLRAMRTVPRERFVPRALAALAYDDAALPIEEGQTISQPYVVARMAEALELGPHDRVLEVGAGSGYSAAVLGEIAAEVYTIERHPALARLARRRLAELGYANVHVVEGDGSLGWPAAAPYDAIAVTAGGPRVPEALKEQLADGGRLVMPVGARSYLQRLVRLRKSGDGYAEEDLGGVQFVPLIGEQGWPDGDRRRARDADGLTDIEPFETIEEAPLGPLLDRIGAARVVLLGQATCGSAEFYRLRARITAALIERKGFRAVALDADWRDAARIDACVADPDAPAEAWQAAATFPAWIWRNREFGELVAWLRQHNAAVEPRGRVGVHGLDRYGSFRSTDAVLTYLEDVDAEAAAAARERYGCLTPWQSVPSPHGRERSGARLERFEPEVLAMLSALAAEELGAAGCGDRWQETGGAQAAASAERYYRAFYRGSREAWNLRARHLFETLDALRRQLGPDAGVVVWPHNLHAGDASYTDVGGEGQLSLGQLCRRAYGPDAYLVGFGTDHGTVAAATQWGGDMQVMRLCPSIAGSYERLCHTAQQRAFYWPLAAARGQVGLAAPRLERAVGVVYRPQSERASHYFSATLAGQFDEWVWIDETEAVQALPAGVPVQAARDVSPQSL